MPREPEAVEIGRRIASIRKRRGFSQASISRRAGIDPSYLSRLETGRVHPTVRMAMRIARALRVPIEELLGPTPPQRTSLPCPVSGSGQCLMDLIDVGGADTDGRPERYTARQLKLMRRFAELIRGNDAEILRTFETLIGRMRPPEETSRDGP